MPMTGRKMKMKVGARPRVLSKEGMLKVSGVRGAAAAAAGAERVVLPPMPPARGELLTTHRGKHMTGHWYIYWSHCSEDATML